MVVKPSEAEGMSDWGPFSPPWDPYDSNDADFPLTAPEPGGIRPAGPTGDGTLGGPLPTDRAETRPHSDARRRTRSVVVLLPALNEELAIGTVIDRIPTERLTRAGYDVQVWVVDGKSTDATFSVARDHGANIFVQVGNGKGSGVRQVLEYLLTGTRDEGHDSRRLFIMLDADGSYPPEDIPAFVDALESGSDVVVGSRFRGRVEDGSITAFNRLGNRLLSRLAGLLFGVPVSDVCTGMWAFREDSLKHFGFVATGFALEPDLFASTCEQGARFTELPIEYRRRIGEAKLVPFRTGLLIAWRLLMKRLNPPEHQIARSAGRRTPVAEETS